MNAPNALGALQKAQKDRQAKARKEAMEAPIAPVDETLDATEALIQIAVAAYGYGITFGMGALPDGSAIYGRLRVPSKSNHPCSGMVAFVVSDDPVSVLRKAVAALESPPTSKFWKPDQFAQS